MSPSRPTPVILLLALSLFGPHFLHAADVPKDLARAARSSKAEVRRPALARLFEQSFHDEIDSALREVEKKSRLALGKWVRKKKKRFIRGLQGEVTNARRTVLDLLDDPAYLNGDRVPSAAGALWSMWVFPKAIQRM